MLVSERIGLMTMRRLKCYLCRHYGVLQKSGPVRYGRHLVINWNCCMCGNTVDSELIENPRDIAKFKIA